MLLEIDNLHSTIDQKDIKKVKDQKSMETRRIEKLKEAQYGSTMASWSIFKSL